MINIDRPELDREENYLVKATLIIDGDEINDVLCKIYLPERIHEKPFVILKASKEDEKIIMNAHKGALKAAVYDFDNEIQTSIETSEVYFPKGFTKYWGKDIFDITILGEPQDLHVIDHAKREDNPPKTHISFWISPNRFLTPFMSSCASYTGEIEIDRRRDLEFTLKDSIKLKFDKHYRYKTAKNKDLIQWSYLVADTELDFPATNVEKIKHGILPYIDDFLLLASFAARKRTICLGWNADDRESYTTFYRGNYIFPTDDDSEDIVNILVDFQHFESFLKKSYPVFLHYKNKLAFRSSLHSMVPLQPHTLESSFLERFAGLETLILDFRRRENLEFIIPKGNWKDLKKYLKRCLSESTAPGLEKEQRKSIYQKLNELNRLSLREAFELFRSKNAIYLRDLWPVFGNEKEAGLVEIRNKLIHGDPFPRELVSALAVANEHLAYTLERAILRILNWDIAKTNVNPEYLRINLKAIEEMPSEQSKLSKHIRNSK